MLYRCMDPSRDIPRSVLPSIAYFGVERHAGTRSINPALSPEPVRNPVHSAEPLSNPKTIFSATLNSKP